MVHKKLTWQNAWVAKFVLVLDVFWSLVCHTSAAKHLVCFEEHEINCLLGYVTVEVVYYTVLMMLLL